MSMFVNFHQSSPCKSIFMMSKSLIDDLIDPSNINVKFRTNFFENIFVMRNINSAQGLDMPFLVVKWMLIVN
jgi:hypothetical protein